MKRSTTALATVLVAAMTSFGTMAYANSPNATAAQPTAATPSTPTTQPKAAAASMQKGPMLSQKRIEEIQVALAKGVSDHVAIDGVWGPQTVKALRDFQKQNGLPVTGKLTQATMSKLNPPTWKG